MQAHEAQIADTKEIRVRIHKLADAVAWLPIQNKESEEAIKKLDEAHMWLEGHMRGLLNSYDMMSTKTTVEKVIEVTQDQLDDSISGVRPIDTESFDSEGSDYVPGVI